MYCNQCGAQNDPAAGVCNKCGAHLEPIVTAPPAGYPSQGYAPAGYPPPAGPVPPGYAPAGYPPPAAPVKKKHTGLIIGLICGGVVLIGAAIAAYFLFFAGTDVSGTWVCEDRGWVLEMQDGKLSEYGPFGTETARYDYNKGSGTGTAELTDGGVSFTVKNDRMDLTVEDTDESYRFERSAKKADIEAAVIGGFAGLWSSEAQGEVLEFTDAGVIKVYSGPGDFEGTFDFNIDNGKGTISLQDKSYDFSVGWDQLDIPDIGSYIHAKKSLDIAAFVAQFATVTPANPLIGSWYETTGEYGSIDFYDDGTFLVVYLGENFYGVYTYDAASGTGSATMDSTGDMADFTYADGMLVLDGQTYTMDHVDLPPADDTSALMGTWYETSGIDENFTFYSDGTISIYSLGGYYYGTYTYDSATQTGSITFDYDGTESYLDFTFYSGVLTISDYTYSQEYVPPATTDYATDSILGTWYDTAGMQGTLYFDKDGLAIMDSYGTMFYGTYVFDEATATGTMTLDYVEGEFTWNLFLWDGSLYTDDATYTKDYVEQTTNTDVS